MIRFAFIHVAVLLASSVCLSLVLSPCSVAGQEISALEVMQKYKEQRSSDDERSIMTMKLINSRGRERSRKLEVLTMTETSGEQKMLIRVISPEDIRGTAFLIIENEDKDDDQWLYLPAFRRVRRVLSNEKSDSFLGSDYAYEDFESEQLDNYSYTLKGEDTLEGISCWIIEAVPLDEKTKQESGYGKRELWIRCDNFLGFKTHFFNKKGELFKQIEASDIRQIANSDKWRAHELEMKNLVSGHRTLLRFEDYIIDQGIPAGVFTRANLERGN